MTVCCGSGNDGNGSNCSGNNGANFTPLEPQNPSLYKFRVNLSQKGFPVVKALSRNGSRFGRNGSKFAGNGGNFSGNNGNGNYGKSREMVSAGVQAASCQTSPRVVCTCQR